MPIKFPNKPTGEEYEDYVSASLRALGYFTETNLILKEHKKEILELDIVASYTPLQKSKKYLFEIKKDAFHFPNIFKLYGQKEYLGIDKAFLVGFKDFDDKSRKIYCEKGEELSVSVCNYDIETHPTNIISPCNDVNNQQYPIIAKSIWYNNIGQRLAYHSFKDVCNQNNDKKIYNDALNYHSRFIRSFFNSTSLERTSSLYNSYLQSPKIPGKFIALLSNNMGLKEKKLWNRVKDTSQHIWIQYLMLVEHKARISIIKNALDYILNKNKKTLPKREVKINGDVFSIPKHILPTSFENGFRTIGENNYSMNLPFLFQFFIENMGGFIFYKDKEELNFIEKMTGIPSAKIVSSLHILDKFFAKKDSSLFYSMKDKILVMKMIPGFIKGGGCFLRKSIFELDNYKQKYENLSWLLGKWHNALYKLLEPHLQVQNN